MSLDYDDDDDDDGGGGGGGVYQQCRPSLNTRVCMYILVHTYLTHIGPTFNT